MARGEYYRSGGSPPGTDGGTDAAAAVYEPAKADPYRADGTEAGSYRKKQTKGGLFHHS